MRRSLCRSFAVCVSGLLPGCGGTGAGNNNNGGGGGSRLAATHFSVTTPQDATVGAPFSFTVTALDGSNPVATNYAGTMHFASTDSQAVLPTNSTLANGTSISFANALACSGLTLRPCRPIYAVDHP